MAAPHVRASSRLSCRQRREFIGRPTREGHPAENCTISGAIAYMQGAGMPNLVKMLAFN